MPNTRPSGLVIPSTPQTDPLGFQRMSPLTAPWGSAYWVAICPFSSSRRTHSPLAINRPSPWETGTVCKSPARTPASQGDFTLATRVTTIRDTWRPRVLKVKVGSSSLGSTIFP